MFFFNFRNNGNSFWKFQTKPDVGITDQEAHFLLANKNTHVRAILGLSHTWEQRNQKSFDHQQDAWLSEPRPGEDVAVE